MFFPFYLFLDTTIQQQFQATFSLCCLMMCWCAGQCYQYDHISLRHKKTDRSYRSGPKQQITWSRSFKWIIEYSYFEYICAKNKNHLKFDARSNNRKSKHRLTYKMFSLAYSKWIGIRYWWLTVRNVLHTLKRDCKRVDVAMHFVCSIRHTHMSMQHLNEMDQTVIHSHYSHNLYAEKSKREMMTFPVIQDLNLKNLNRKNHLKNSWRMLIESTARYINN